MGHDLPNVMLNNIELFTQCSFSIGSIILPNPRTEYTYLGRLPWQFGRPPLHFFLVCLKGIKFLIIYNEVVILKEN